MGRRSASKQIIYLVIFLVLSFFLVSCATARYQRTLIFKGTNATLRIRETLSVKSDKFVFVKQSINGKALFEGTIKRDGNRWEFHIKHFKPTNATDRYFDPPIVYVYRVKRIPGGGIEFSSPDVKGPRSPLQFIMRGRFFPG